MGKSTTHLSNHQSLPERLYEVSDRKQAVTVVLNANALQKAIFDIAKY